MFAMVSLHEDNVIIFVNNYNLVILTLLEISNL
jgi:hypothetical protein